MRELKKKGKASKQLLTWSKEAGGLVHDDILNFFFQDVDKLVLWHMKQSDKLVRNTLCLLRKIVEKKPVFSSFGGLDVLHNIT